MLAIQGLKANLHSLSLFHSCFSIDTGGKVEQERTLKEGCGSSKVGADKALELLNSSVLS